jgi:hypothetical protein
LYRLFLGAPVGSIPFGKMFFAALRSFGVGIIEVVTPQVRV